MGGIANAVNYNDIQYMAVVARAVTNANVCFFMGLVDQVAINGGNTDNVAFYYDTLNVGTQLRCQTTRSGLQEPTHITVPPANVWHLYEMFLSPTQVVFKIDETTVAVHSDIAKLPLGQTLTPYITIFARENDYKQLDLDLFWMKGTLSVPRYP